MVNNLKKAYEAQSKVEPHEATCIADKGDEGDVDFTLIVGVVGVLDKDLNDSHILPGIAMDKVVHVFGNISFGWLDGIANVAYFLDLYHVLYFMTYVWHFIFLLYELGFVWVLAAPVIFKDE